MTVADYISSFELNQISHRRARLSFDEAVAVWLLHWQNEHSHIIAARPGTNPGRIAEVLAKTTHPGACGAAAKLRFS